MNHLHTKRTLCAALAFALVARSLVASPPDVKDPESVFSADAIARANQQSRDIHSHYDADLIVEYTADVPATSYWDQVKKKILEYKRPASRQRFYADWAKRNARAAGPDSIYVLICKEPAPLHVEVAIGPNLRQRRKFTEADAGKLRQILQALFQSGQNDEALAIAASSVRETLKANLGKSIAPVQPNRWTEVMSVIGGLTALYLGLMLFHRARITSAGVRPPTLTMSSGSYASDMYRVANDNWVQHLASWLKKDGTRIPLASPVAEHPDEAATRYDPRHAEHHG